MAMEWGRSHVMAFSNMLNAFAPTIFCILWYNFLLNVANYAFYFSFSCINLQASFQAWPKMWGKGRGWLTLCGPSGGMWTQVGGDMIGGVMSRRGVMYANWGAGPRNQN